jgi:hypothetical protein
LSKSAFAAAPTIIPVGFEFESLVGGVGLELLDVINDGLVDVGRGEGGGIGELRGGGFDRGQCFEVHRVLEFLGLLNPARIDNIGGNRGEVSVRNDIADGERGGHRNLVGADTFGIELDLTANGAFTDGGIGRDVDVSDLARDRNGDVRVLGDTGDEDILVRLSLKNVVKRDGIALIAICEMSHNFLSLAIYFNQGYFDFSESLAGAGFEPPCGFG